MKKYVDENPEYFAIVDIPKFSLLETDEGSVGHFVDTRDSGRAAERIRDHSLFAHRLEPERYPTRLFVPDEAKADVLQLIQGGHA